jgi:hypothetical protein
MEWLHLFFKIMSNIKDNIKMGIGMAGEGKPSKMEVFMKECGKTTNLMEKVHLFNQMVVVMKANLKNRNVMDMVNLHQVIRKQFMRVILKMINKMVMVLKVKLVNMFTLVILKIE